MYPLTVVSFFAIVVAAVLMGPSPSASAVTSFPRDRTTTSPLPPRKERLPYTPVRNSTRKDRLPFTPPKTTTTRRPGSPYLLRTTTTKRVPFPLRTTPKPCNCKCDLSDFRPLCAVDDRRERTTFVNQCQLNCQSCLDNKRYQVVMEKECSK